MAKNSKIQISTSVLMSDRLGQLNDIFERSARQNLEEFLASSDGSIELTATEKDAMIKLEQLKLIGDLSLTEIILRGEVIKEIEAKGYWSAHPDGFASMEEAAEAQGISQSEYSNIRDLCEVIFPYLSENRYNIADLWESIGKSKFRELIPILKRAITNQESRSSDVERFYQNEIDSIFATARGQGESITEVTARTQLIDEVIQTGQLPIRELRERIRPSQRHTMQAYEIPYGENRKVVMMIVEEDGQQEIIDQRFSNAIDIRVVSLDRARQDPEFQAIARWLQGE